MISNRIKREDNKCSACPPTSALPYQEGHHIWPTSLSGPQDGPLAYICGSCHSKIHKQALQMYKNLPVENLTVVQAILVKIIVKAMVAEQPNIANTPRNIMFKVTDQQLKRMHKRKLDLGYTNLIDYVKSLIEKDLKEL